MFNTFSKGIMFLFLVLIGHFTMKKPTVIFTRFIWENKFSIHGLEKQRNVSTIANNIENLNTETAFAI